MADPFCGEIRMFAGYYCPVNWFFCDGRLVDMSAYPVLYSLIGTIYGGNNTQFALPNLCGRVPLGSGQQPGGATYGIAQTGGSERVTLTTANIPNHNHQFSVNSALATSQTPNTGLTMGAVNSSLALYTDTRKGVGPVRNFAPEAISTTGGNNMSHDNMMPTMTFNYIICYNGLYPS